MMMMNAMDDSNVVNPAVPTSTGALLAEEWTINPLATLPSFLEMFMMDEASRSAHKSLESGMDLFRQKLEHRVTTTTGAGNNNNHITNNNNNTSQQPPQASATTSSTVISYVKSILERSTVQCATITARLIQRYGPEISCLIMYVIERHCLRSDACATFSESLYGGRIAKLDYRTPPPTTTTTTPTNSNNSTQHKLLPLNDRDKTRLALLVALGPYIRQRLFQLYKKIKMHQEQQQQQQSTPTGTTGTADRVSLLVQKLQRLFVFMYPLLHVSLSSCDLAYQWRYLLGRSVFYHPYSHFLGLIVRRVTQEDATTTTTTKTTTKTTTTRKEDRSNNITTAAVSNNNKSNNNHNLKSTVAVSPGSPSLVEEESSSSALRRGAFWILSSAVVLSWISHFRAEYRRQRQALIIQQQQRQQQRQQQGNTNQSSRNNYTNNDDSHNRIVRIQNSTPPPPPPPASGIKNVEALLPSHLCPLCRRERMHPTASTSGFVFCYKCLLQNVQETGKCPVTGRDCKEAQLLRLYEPNDTSTTTATTTSHIG